MTEQAPENDFRQNAQDMTPEANADVSRGHLMRWAYDHNLVHFRDGEMVVDEDLSDPEQPSEEKLRELQDTVSLREAGDRRRKFRHWRRAS